MKIKSGVLTVLSAFLIFLLLIHSKLGITGALNGLSISYHIIIPSLLPISVFSIVLFEIGLLQRINLGNVSIFLISMLGGYPVGAKIIDKEYNEGKISRKNAELTLYYCVNSAPSFTIISVGLGMLSDIRLGYILFFANLLSSLLLAFAISFFKEKEEIYRPTSNNICFSEIFCKSTYEATQSVLSICGTIVLFSAIIEIVNNLSNIHFINTIFLPLIEITNGIVLAKNNIYAIAFLLGFSGICVHFQILSMCKSVKPNYIKFFFIRVIHGMLSALITKAIVSLLRIEIQTITTNLENVFRFSKFSAVFGISFILLSIMFIISVSKGQNKM